MSEISTKRRESLFKKLLDKQITINKARTFTLEEWNNKFGSKIKSESSLKAQKRLLNQVESHIDDIIDYHEKRIKDLEKLKKPEPKEPKKKKQEFPTKKGQYGIVLVVDQTNQNEFWIKYKSKKHFNKQLEKLLLDSLDQNFTIDYQGIGVYKEFTDSNFLDELGITL